MRLPALTAAAALLIQSPGAAQVAGHPAVLPITHVGAGGAGYLADPQPVRRAPNARTTDLFLSGTTKAVVRCPFPLRPQGCTWRPLRVDAAGLQAAMAAAGVSLTNIQNTDIFQADDGSWHAAVTVGVQSASHPRHWTVVAHAHPVGGGAGPDAPPEAWSADALLAGSLSDPEAGNYDGKYIEEDDRLYLLYVRNTHPAPAIRNEIVLQPMATFTASTGPARAILATGDRYGDLNSEWYANTQAKLVEAPWIAIIGGKHALIYSTGSYLTPGYKAAVAWSDSLLPAGGGTYRKVLQPDPKGIWRSAGGHDVRYLVQSERLRWPDFIGGDVTGPGVASVVQGPGGTWWLIFNGFSPGTLRTLPNGKVDGAPRRPFATRMLAAVPQGTTVTAASDANLASWLSLAR